MPGMLYHLYFGKVVLDSMAVVSELKVADTKIFMAGNILPDMATAKHGAHYYHKPEGEGFYLPDLTLVEKALPEISDQSLRLGITGHLYLDERFTREYLMKHFQYDVFAGTVKSARTGQKWTMAEFLSAKGLYHGYGECNGLLLRDKMVDLEWVWENVPEELPMTGIEVLDRRVSRSWREELCEYLMKVPEYTGRVLVYGEVVDFVRRCAMDFVLRGGTMM